MLEAQEVMVEAQPEVRPPRRGASVAVALVAMVIAAAGLTACGSSQARRSVANLPSRTGSTTSTTDATQSDQAMIAYARCLRAHGIDEPDLFHRPGHTGLTIAIQPRTSRTAPALDACGHFIQRIVQMKLAGGPTITASRLAAFTAFARCMRTRDIPMLDPDRYGDLNLGDVPGIANGFGRYSPQFRAADGACRHLLPAGVHDDGSGP